MKAVVFNGPQDISVQDRPIPQIQDDQDIIVKVQAAALCGSELHVYRGLEENSGKGFIMGHEFTGIVTAVGSSVKTLQVGDKVVSPFTISCDKLKSFGKCFYCRNGYTSRCAESRLFGSAKLDGGQADYVRIPFADSTAVKAPSTVSDEALILMADIFPTGYYSVKSALGLCGSIDIRDATIAVIGCGPVGLCSIVAAALHKPKHLFAIDGVESRLEQAKALGAEPLNYLKDKDGMEAQIKAATEGRGADIVIEVVGLSAALRTAFDLIRPFGTISSIGVHNGEIPWSGNEGYRKNIRVQMGRCPVRAIFQEALTVLGENQDKFGFMYENVMPLSAAQEGYELFNSMKVQKVIFKP